MELKIRARMTIKDLNDDVGGEWGLAVAAARYYIGQCVNDKAQKTYDQADDRKIVSMFLWKRYLEGRAWLENHKSLACCLQLRRAFQPWELRQDKISQ